MKWRYIARDKDGLIVAILEIEHDKVYNKPRRPNGDSKFSAPVQEFINRYTYFGHSVSLEREL